MGAQDTTPDAERPSSTGFLLALVALIWMAAMLWSARATITGGGDAEMEVTSTAYALPGAVTGALVAGAAVALAVITRLTRRRELGATVRFAVTTGVGLVLGALGALVIITINTDGWIYAVVGGTVAAAATIGGALAGFRQPRVLAATCWAAIAVFLVGFVLNVFQDPVLKALGSGSTQASQTTAASWFTFLQSVLSGVAAGLTAYAVLRRFRRRASGADLSWPLYSLAGAGPGLLLMAGEALTRTAGSRVLALAGKVSELELMVQRMLSGARFNSALIVLFVGAISATIAVGRTIKPAEAPAEPEPPAKPAKAAPKPETAPAEAE
jgi:iron complex transport system permease protein